jgi:hypothetical protein
MAASHRATQDQGERGVYRDLEGTLAPPLVSRAPERGLLVPAAEASKARRVRWCDARGRTGPGQRGQRHKGGDDYAHASLQSLA